MTKARIDTYSTIFDMDFIVANDKVTLEDLRSQYEYTDGSELEDNYTEWDLCTGIVKRKSDGAHCVLVKYNRMSKSFVSSGDRVLDLVDCCAHEATHVALDIYNATHTEIDFNNQECFAYFMAYITERIFKTISNK